MFTKLLCSVSALLALASAACSDCGPGSATSGTAAAAWSIALGGRPATCAQVGAASVSVLLHSRDGADVTTSFDCTDGRGVSLPIVANAYDATLTLRAADGAVMVSSSTQGAITIGAGQVTALTPVVFTAAGRGKLTLAIVPLSDSLACRPRNQGGLGLTSHEISIVRAEGACTPVTLVRTRGRVVVGTFLVNCSTPQTASCIERDELLTIESMPSGPYLLGVHGWSGVFQCGAANDVFVVPSNGALTKRVQLAPQDPTHC